MEANVTVSVKEQKGNNVINSATNVLGGILLSFFIFEETHKTPLFSDIFHCERGCARLLPKCNWK